ncbi:MAG: hypothetical protein QXK88_01580 [Desulfurococcaceae archaeon]
MKWSAVYALIYSIFALSYVLPWATLNGEALYGFSIQPFSLPYLIGAAVGLLTFVSKRRLTLLVLIAGLLGVIGVLLVAFWWYGLALHYFAGSGVKVLLEPGAWLALVSSALYAALGALIRRRYA